MSGLIKKLTTISLVAVGMSLSAPALAHESDAFRDAEIDWLVSMVESEVADKYCVHHHKVSDQFADSVKAGFEKQITGYTFSYEKMDWGSDLCITKDPLDYSFTDMYNWMGNLIK